MLPVTQATPQPITPAQPLPFDRKLAHEGASHPRATCQQRAAEGNPRCIACRVRLAREAAAQ